MQEGIPTTGVTLQFWQLLLVVTVAPLLSLAAVIVPLLLNRGKAKGEAAGQGLLNLKTELELAGEEGSVQELLRKKVTQLVKEALDNEQKLATKDSEIAAKDLQIKIAHGQIKNYQEMIQQIVLEQGKALQRADTAEAEMQRQRDRLKDVENELQRTRERRLERENKDLKRGQLQLRGEANAEDTAGDTEAEPQETQG